MLLRGDSVMSPHFRTAQAMAGCADMLRSARTMLTRTHTVSFTARAAAAVCGVKTVCEYVAVEIGGYTVMVDPIRVVSVVAAPIRDHT